MRNFSFQLYSARNFPPLKSTLKMLASLGYERVEGYGGIYQNVEILAADLSALNLRMPTGHFDLPKLENAPDACIKIANILGIKTIYCPWIEPGDRQKNAQEWQEFGARLQSISKPFIEAGFAFGWHNHDFEVVELDDGSYPIDRIFEGGPNLEWEIDVAWITRAGKNPIEFIKKHANRITAVHAKDLAIEGEAESEDGWEDFGHGRVEWDEIMKALNDTNVGNFIIEHDNPSDLDRFARRSLATAKTFMDG